MIFNVNFTKIMRFASNFTNCFSVAVGVDVVHSDGAGPAATGSKAWLCDR